MPKKLKTWSQQRFNYKADVVLHTDSAITVNGMLVTTYEGSNSEVFRNSPERSLANIILRLNAEKLEWKEQAEKNLVPVYHHFS